ncbi:MAG: alpha/beta hydrolase [Solobacterium sp.]|nr:alpha/beta hydrolase [Solobacterium sp.]
MLEKTEDGVMIMHEIKTVQVNGVKLAYREYGSGDKYLLSTQNFFFKDCHMALLGQPPYDYHCFLVYMRGYGESDHIYDQEKRDYAEIWGKDLLAFADVMGIDTFYYTGISHGNWAAWYAAFHQPERIRGYVCCDGITQYHEERDLPAPLAKMRDHAREYVGNEELLRRTAWLEEWPTENPERLTRRKANMEEHLDILMHRKEEEFALSMLGDMTGCHAQSQEELLERLHEIDFPVMIWMGGKDQICSAEDALQTAQAIPGAQYLMYQHLGHGGADEMPELAARDCDRFFKDTEGRIL